MQNFYFFLGFILLITAFTRTISFINSFNFYNDFIEKAKEISSEPSPIKKKLLSTSYFKKHFFYILHSFFSLIWLLFGLLTDQWEFFAIYFLFSFLIVRSIKKISKNKTYQLIMYFLSSFIYVLFLGFVVFNHFHFNIDFNSIF